MKHIIAAFSLIAALGFSDAATVQAQARYNGAYRYPMPGYRNYVGYPYRSSWGYRIDPYWSYSSTRQPYGYQGDGSYYGLGYSRYGGQGNNYGGNYWYW
ncbi:hypothetical protein CVU37_04100 [candidate division BRC1 bacterium HGW-BRC1-1]|nr:MAG: hypothetical protein CVU37_04100 [candidate division BRC1 bacterium HGW-BRC1-1]